MKKILLFIAFVGILGIGYAQTPSPKMKELQEICLKLRNNLGNEQIIYQTTSRYERFMRENLFTSDFAPLKKKMLSRKECIVEDNSGGHILFIPQYFRELLENPDNLFGMYEELLAEWDSITKERARSAKGGAGYIFRQDNLILCKGTSITFELTVPKGPFDIMAVAEPNAFLAMEIQNLSTDQFYTTEKVASGHKWFEFDVATTLKVTIKNVSQKDASIALFCF